MFGKNPKKNIEKKRQKITKLVRYSYVRNYWSNFGID